jgi:hypothetical protein
MRRLLPLLLLGLAGCADALGPAVAVNAASLTLIGRTVPDAAISLVSGRDCSIAHLDLWEPYCRPEIAATPPARLCTRSLGDVDCWQPAQLPSPLRGIADGPPPRPAQSWVGRALGQDMSEVIRPGAAPE